MSAKTPRAGFLKVPGSSVSIAQIVETPCLVVRRQTFINPVVADVDGIVATHVHGPGAGLTVNITIALMDGVTLGLLEGTGRNVTVLVSHASAVVICNGVITGLDMYGNVITETWSVTAGTTGKTYTGTKAFKKITNISIYSASDASTNEVTAGFGKPMGLDRICATARLLAEAEDGANPTAGAIVKGVAASATADARGTYSPSSAQNGALDFDIWYIVETVDAITQ